MHLIVRVGKLHYFFMFFLTYSQVAAREYWYMEGGYINNIDMEDAHDIRLSGRLGYKTNKNSLYLKHSSSKNTNKMRLDVVHYAKYKYMNGSRLMFLSEITYNYNKGQWAGEFTPIYYIKYSENLFVGMELEIDFYKNNIIDIYEIEIEPTIMYKTKLGPGRLKFEMEAPVTRIYTNSKSKDNLEIETIEIITKYTLPILNNLFIILESSIPYDLKKEKVKQKYGVSLRYQFCAQQKSSRCNSFIKNYDS